MSAAKRRKERLKALNAWQKKAQEVKKARLLAAQEFVRLTNLEKARLEIERRRLQAIEDERIEAERLVKDRPTIPADMEAW